LLLPHTAPHPQREPEQDLSRDPLNPAHRSIGSRIVGDADTNGHDTTGTLRTAVLAVELMAAAGIAAWALVNIWTLAYPPEPGAVCALVYPPPPGCSPQARFTPAFISAIVISLSYGAVTVLLLTIGRRSGFVAVWALGGLILLSVLTDQFVTWGGMPG
jgi:hypothetical protein